MKPSSYKSILLVVLLLTFAFNAVDRLALGLLLQSIKLDLSLSDTQLGLLSGIAFSTPCSACRSRARRIAAIGCSSSP
jgi:hypothetical protein